MIDESASRAAVITWRDEAALSAIALVYDSAMSAMQTLEAQLDAIAVADAMRDAEAFARKAVRPAMRATTGAAADRWFTAHAGALRKVDVRLEPLALRFAALGERPALPLEQEVSAVLFGPTWLRRSADALSSSIERVTGEVAGRALPNAVRARANRLTSRLAHEIATKSGAHERLRAGGRSELTRAWIGISDEDGVPRSYLAQLLEAIDRTAAQAKDIIA